MVCEFNCLAIVQCPSSIKRTNNTTCSTDLGLSFNTRNTVDRIFKNVQVDLKIDYELLHTLNDMNGSMITTIWNGLNGNGYDGRIGGQMEKSREHVDKKSTVSFGPSPCWG